MCSYKSRVYLYSSHLCGNHGFPFRIHRCLNKKKKKEMNINEILSRHLSASFAITNAPTALVAMPARAVVRARNVGTVRIYVTVMTSIPACVAGPWK